MDCRAISPLLGTVLLVAVTVALATTVGAMVVTSDMASESSTVRLSANADAATETLSLTHEGGSTLNPDTLTMRIHIDGTALDRQPPIPFFAAKGFVSGPTGPFNAATKGEWTAGETGSLQLATTNAPNLAVGDRVEFTLLDGESVIATVETTAQ